MSVKIIVLEHEVLKALYTKGIMVIRAHGNEIDGHQPIFKKVYTHANFYFGTLCDIINNPDEYTFDKFQKGNVMHLNAIKKTVEQIKIATYECGEVSDAIEILAINKHVNDNTIGENLNAEDRKVSLTPVGALAFRSKFYIKEALKELSVETGYEIQRKDLWQK